MTDRKLVRSASMETPYDEDGSLMIDEAVQTVHPKETEVAPRQVGDYCKLDIDNDCFVVANEFQGRTLIHIRYYDTNASGKLYPTKKGVSLTPQHWKKLQMLHCKTVDEAIRKYKEGDEIDLRIHLGRNNHVSLQTGFPKVNIRRWFMPDPSTNELKPTRAGVALSFEQWEKLKNCMLTMPEYIGDILDNVEFCDLSHHNQESFFSCYDCSPNQTVFL
ncbi:uncharacterized protein LOC117339973 [Pecten maximus]|uniref:uncharacterized protein LOC117339973 n=1 Tax=Pecten maximus TaxID=6579 RepID=UPI00145863E2|nr:uncharacterized protein LOC117339973 [Pecten maximus]